MKRSFCLILLMLTIFSGCEAQSSITQWGSFSSEKTISYDEAYYALQEVVEIEDTTYINVEIYTADGVLAASFQPARARDFWGICWERDTYNIWVQSGDAGILCYSYNNGEWSLNTAAIRPDYIISKYDDIA